MGNKNIEYIYEPLDQFKKVYKELHNKNVNEYFDDLIKKSNTDVEANRETIKKLKTKESRLNRILKRLNSYKTLRLILIILSIVGVILTGSGILALVDVGYSLAAILLVSISPPLVVLFIFLLFKKIKPIINETEDVKKRLAKEIKDLQTKAWNQVKQLIASFTDTMSLELMRKTVPIIEFDNMFDQRRLDYFVTRFGLNTYSDENRSALYIKSGEIQGNPFYIAQDLVHTMGTKTYTGSKTITYTTYRTVNGKRQPVINTQVLTATVTKPCPFYSEHKYLVYGNEAAPDLSFTRRETDVEHLTERQIARKVRRDAKQLERKARKSTKKGTTYTALGNSEFEVLFGATDRDHEVQFRLLFTPLAQKQLLALMKEKEYGYGDEFDFIKKKKINYIFPKHLQKFDINIALDYFVSLDVDVIRKRFVTYNNEFFRQMYFTFAPLLSIPLYQQQKPQEYIYKDLYDGYVSFYEHEHVVNKMNATEFKHPLSQTRNILKTSLVNSGDNVDQVKVTAYGYQAIKQIDVVMRLGRDGRTHGVPVEWIKYVPVSQDTLVNINVPEDKKELSYNERIRAMFTRLQNKNINKRDLYRIGSLVAYIENKNRER